MTLSRRAVAVSVVAGATIVACLTVGPNLSTTQQAAVVVTTPIDFGDVQIHTTAVGPEIVISPSAGGSDSDDTITAVSYSCTDFTVTFTVPVDVFRHCGGAGTGTSVEPQNPTAIGAVESDAVCSNPVVQVARFPVSFHPTQEGPKSCQVAITVRDSAGSNSIKNVFLQGNATLPPFAMTVEPAAINFGDVRLGRISTQDVIITNAGANPISLTGATFNPTSVFSASALPASLASKQSAVLTVACQPVTATLSTSTLTVTASNNLSGSVGLTCRGTDSTLEYVPSVDPIIARVDEPVTQTIQVFNRGNVDANITKFELVWKDTSSSSEVAFVPMPPPPVTLGSGSSTTIAVRYDAKTERKLGQLATLTVTQAIGKTDEVIVNGEARPTSLGVTPDGHDFATVCTNTTQMIDVRVFAAQTGRVGVVSVAAPAPFAFAAKAGTTIPGSVEGDAFFTFVASVTPRTPGVFTETVTINTDIPKDLAHPVTFHVNALEAGIGTPLKVDYGTRVSLEPTAERALITNCTGGDLEIVGARIEPDASTDPFELTILEPKAQDLRRTLGQAGSMEFLISLSPRSNGVKSGQLVIEHSSFDNRTTTAIPLEASVTGGPGDPLDQRETYYNCSAGGAGATPVGLALLALSLGRRRHRGRPEDRRRDHGPEDVASLRRRRRSRT